MRPSLANYSTLSTGLLVVSLLALSACGSNEQTEAQPERLRPVKYMQVNTSQGGQTHTYSGTLKAGSEVKRSFKVGGTLTSVRAKVGDHLKKADVIATLDKKQYELQVDKSSATLAQSVAEKRNADSKYKRSKSLYSSNSISRDDLESARAASESARAQVSSSNKSLELARLDLGYTVLRAVQSCAVAAVPVEVNENVTVGATIVSLNCGKVNEVSVSVPESIIAQIEKDMVASVTFDSISGEVFSAVVTEVGVSSGGGAVFPVTLTLDRQHDRFRSGSAAQVTFSTSSSNDGADRLYLPPVAVGEDVDGRFVYVLEQAESETVAVVRRQSVDVGELTSLGLEILTGIESGYRIVTAGTSVIRDGLRVKVGLE